MSTLQTLKRPDRYLKAIMGALAAGLTTALGALPDGPLTAYEWVSIAVAVVVTFNAVYWPGNAPTPPDEEPPA